MATYLVTGAAGFIASRVCELLLAGGHAVVGLDNLNDYYDVRLKEYRLSRLLGEGTIPAGTRSGGPWRKGHFEFRFADIEDSAALEEVFAAHRFDAVINLAARAGVRASLKEPQLYVRTNVDGARRVLECQRKFGVKKHVLASSSSLYAGCRMPFVETQVTAAPQSPYAGTKQQAEEIAREYHERHGIDVSVLRYFTVFGPAGRPDMAPYRFIKWIDEGTPITLFGDGSQARDFTYVDDIARGTVLALQPLGYEVVNLGGGRNPLSLLTIIGFIEQALGKTARIEGQPPSSADMRETWADIAKAKRLLGWEPQVPAEEGFRRTVAWHVANRELVRSIAV